MAPGAGGHGSLPCERTASRAGETEAISRIPYDSAVESLAGDRNTVGVGTVLRIGLPIPVWSPAPDICRRRAFAGGLGSTAAPS